MRRVTWRSFGCPICLRVTTKPWSEAWCPHDLAYTLQAFDPSGYSEMDWGKMVPIDPKRLRALLEDPNA